MLRNNKNDYKYIGESLDLVNRYLTHLEQLKNGTHDNYKLQNEFRSFLQTAIQIYCCANSFEYIS